MNDAMSMSHTGLKMMMQAEGLRLEAYPDPGTGAEPWTVGFGHTGPDVKPGMTITKEQAEMLLRDDVRFAEIGVRSYTTVPLTQSQFDALVDFAYNCGIGAMRGSTMLKKLNSRDYLGASEELLRWNRAGGKVMAGLTKRREAEKEMFLGGTAQA
jgi:lysozyme